MGTNLAFERLGRETLLFLLKPENKAKLVKILEYHVLGAQVLSTDLKNGEKAKTLEGDSVAISITDFFNREIVKINDARVLKADVKGSNGVIHVIDTVLLPPSQ